MIRSDPYDRAEDAALEECRRTHLGRQRWQRGRERPCADCTQDAHMVAPWDKATGFPKVREGA